MEEGFQSAKLPPDLAQRVRRAPVEYVILCPSTRVFPLKREAFSAMLKALLSDTSYGIVEIGQSCLLLRHGADYRRGWQLLQERSGVMIRSKRDVPSAVAIWLENQPLPP